MKIELDREKKITLLQALRRGFIEDSELLHWFDYSTEKLDEIQEELDRLTKLTHPETCKRLQRLNMCLCCKQNENK